MQGNLLTNFVKCCSGGRGKVLKEEELSFNKHFSAILAYMSLKFFYLKPQVFR